MYLYQAIDVWILTTWALVIALMFSSVMGLIGIKSGNSEKDNIFPENKNPINIFWILVVLSPVVEETLFRIIPSYLLDLAGFSGPCWAVGIIIAAFFALMHGVKDDRDNVVIPVPQFIFGCLFWYLVRDMGYEACILSHMSINLFAWLGFFVAIIIKEVRTN